MKKKKWRHFEVSIKFGDKDDRLEENPSHAKRIAASHLAALMSYAEIRPGELILLSEHISGKRWNLNVVAYVDNDSRFRNHLGPWTVSELA